MPVMAPRCGEVDILDAVNPRHEVHSACRHSKATIRDSSARCPRACRNGRRRAWGSVLFGLMLGVMSCSHVLVFKNWRFATFIAPISQSGGTFLNNHGCGTWMRLSWRAFGKGALPFLLPPALPSSVETGQGCFYLCGAAGNNLPAV